MENNNRFKKYALDVVSYIMCSERKARLIKEDIVNHLQEKSSQTGETDPVRLMGEPFDVAQEFTENLDTGLEKRKFEYTSNIYINGIPLVHVNLRNMGIAKGIIAVGTVAIGVVSVGIVSLGCLSLGVLSLALLFAFGAVSAGGIAAFGGLAFSILYAFGGMAVANYCAFGGFAVSNNIAIGGYATGRIIAIGGVARGEISIFNQSGVGEHLFNMNELSTDNIITSIKQIKPDLDGFVQNIIRLFGN